MDDNLLTPYIIIEPAEQENALYFWSMIKRAANMRNRNCMLVQLLQRYRSTKYGGIMRLGEPDHMCGNQ